MEIVKKAGFVLGLLVLAACAPGGDGYETVSFETKAPPASVRPEKAALRLAMAPILSARASGEGLTALVEELSRQTGVTVAPVLGSDYREVNTMLAFGQAEVGVVCTGAFADPQVCEYCDVLLVPLLPSTGAVYHGLIVTGTRREASGFDSLRGRSFLFTDPLSLTGYLYPFSLLCDRNLSPADFFGSVAFSHSHDRSLEAVADGTVEAAAVDEAVYLSWKAADPSRAGRLRVLLRSEAFPSPPLVVRKTLPPAERESLKKAFLELGRRPGGRRALDAMGWTGFQEPDAAYRQRLESLRLFFRHLHEKRCLSP